MLGHSKDYRNFRWFFTSSDVLVVGGKSDEQNEEVIKQFLKPEYTVLHTSAPGSPFMIIQSEQADKTDIEEAAIFCACFSQSWKKNIGEKIKVDIFKGNQMFKSRVMKKGTFAVKGEKKTMTVKPELILIYQKGKMRAVPNTKAFIKKSEILAEISQGKLSKEESANIIIKKIKDKYQLPVSKDEIMAAIPSDKLNVK